jgi:hypothetical protein
MNDDPFNELNPPTKEQMAGAILLDLESIKSVIKHLLYRIEHIEMTLKYLLEEKNGK